MPVAALHSPLPPTSHPTQVRGEEAKAEACGEGKHEHTVKRGECKSMPYVRAVAEGGATRDARGGAHPLTQAHTRPVSTPEGAAARARVEVRTLTRVDHLALAPPFNPGDPPGTVTSPSSSVSRGLMDSMRRFATTRLCRGTCECFPCELLV